MLKKQLKADAGRAKKRIIGIDPGSRILGYAAIDVPVQGVAMISGIQLLEVGVLRAPPIEVHSMRIGMLHNAAAELFERVEPVECVIERAFTGINQLSALRLGEARGAIIAAAVAMGATIREIAPAKAKKVVTGKGNATKEQVAMALEALLGFSRGAMPLDATDALAIAVAHALNPSVLQDDWEDAPKSRIS